MTIFRRDALRLGAATVATQAVAPVAARQDAEIPAVAKCPEHAMATAPWEEAIDTVLESMWRAAEAAEAKGRDDVSDAWRCQARRWLG